MWKFQGSIKKEVEFPWLFMNKLVAFSQVLVFDLGISTSNKGRVFTWSGQSVKIKEFVRGSLIQRKVTEENLHPCKFLTSIKKSYAHRDVCSLIVYGNQLYNPIIFASSSIKMI